jgi:hypothetical protein
MSEIPLAAHRPRTIPLNQVAADIGLSEAAVRRAIQSDTAEQLPDDIRRIPGGRVEGASYYVIAHQYTRVFGPTDLPKPGDMIRRRA